MKALEGDEQALLHACVLNWRMLARHSSQVQLGEVRLAEERKRWDGFLEEQRKAHADSLQTAASEVEARREHVHQVTEMMLQQWQRGDTAGLLATILYNWRQLKSLSDTLTWRRQSVRTAVLRFCEGDRRAAVHMCLLNWKHWAKMEVVFKEEVYDRDRRITQLEERTRSLLGKEQTRLLKYARMIGGSEDSVLLVMVLAGWRQHSSGTKWSETQRQLEVALEERQRLHDLAVTRRRHMAVAALECLGLKDRQAWALDCFLNWSAHWQQAKQEWAHKMAHNKAVSKYAWYAQCQFLKQDTANILAACFWELLREARSQRHAREREEANFRIQESTTLIFQFQEERNDLEEQLKTAYRQIDMITETLQKELKTKEELATELREAYDKLRKQTSIRRTVEISESYFSERHTRASSTSRPSSAHSDSLPHLPAALLGTSGGPNFSLTQALVPGKDNDDW